MAGSTPNKLLTPSETIHFYQDDGYRLEGDLLLRAGIAPRVAIVFCTGSGGTRAGSANGATFATGIADRVDAVTLNFDYSGWGASEGPRHRLDPFREAGDVRCAVSYMRHRYPELQDRIVLFGISFGGGIVAVAGGCDPRVAAVIALSGYASGERFLHDGRPHWQWVEFLERLERDRLTRVLSGQSELVDPDEIIVRDPQARANNQMMLQRYPERRFQLDLISAERILDFDVAGPAAGLRGRPSLFMHADRDLLIPWQSNAATAEAAGGRFVLLPDSGHYDVYAGDPLLRVLDEIASFLVGAGLA